MTEKNVEAVVNGFQGGVAHENYAVEAFEDHTDLGNGVPAIVTVYCHVNVSVESEKTGHSDL